MERMLHPDTGSPGYVFYGNIDGFDEYRALDLPAIMEAVLAHSGHSSFHGVGHSMGGMLFYSLATDSPPEMRSLAGLGVPLISDLRLGGREQRLLNFANRLTRRGG